MWTGLIVRPGFNMLSGAGWTSCQRATIVEGWGRETHDPVALHQRANSRLRTILHVRSYIFLSITINVGPKIFLKAGLGGRRVLWFELLEEHEYWQLFSAARLALKEEFHAPFSSGAAMFDNRNSVKQMSVRS
jgi:hypothetical protein